MIRNSPSALSGSLHAACAESRRTSTRSADLAARGRLLTVTLVLLCVACSSEEAPSLPPSGVLITLDTTNPEALGLYGRAGGVSPHLDQLAREGVVYDYAHSVAPLTLPAHASMLTGLYPVRHTVRDNGHTPLPNSAVTLAELARDAGYQTAAFVAAAVLEEPYGLNQGFDLYRTPSAQSAKVGGTPAERSGAEISSEAITWVRSLDESKPFFLWVHYYDPHAPYTPPKRFFDQAGGSAYRGEISAMDNAIGGLVDALRARGLLDNTLVVVAADHGEALGRHGEETHSVFCYQATMHIPMFVRYPDGYRAGQRSDEVVSLVDVFPTFVEGLQLGAPGDIDGHSLFKRKVDPERGAYFESYSGYLSYGWRPIAGWVDGRGKYIHGDPPEYMNPRRDPDETHNLLPGAESDAERARAAITSLTRLPKLELDGEQSIDARSRERIQALGYAGASDPDADIPGPLDESSLLDARDRLHELKAYYRATELSARGKFAEAMPIVQGILAENPNNVLASTLLGAFHFKLGDYQAAVQTFESIPSDKRNWPNVREFLGHSYEKLGRYEEALEQYRLALELKPGDAHHLQDQARTLRLLEQAGGGTR